MVSDGPYKVSIGIDDLRNRHAHMRLLSDVAHSHTQPTTAVHPEHTP